MCRACGSFYFFEYAPRFRDVFSKNDEIFALASFLLVLKSPVVQLSMINRDLPWVLAFPLPGSSRLSRGQLIYYITSASTCQGVLQNFLKKFFRSPHRRACCALSQSFWIIPHFPCFVKGVRQSFCRFSGTFLRGTKQAALRIPEFPLWEKGFRGGGGEAGGGCSLLIAHCPLLTAPPAPLRPNPRGTGSGSRSGSPRLYRE